MFPIINDFVTVGPNKRVLDRSYTDKLFLVIATNGQYVLCRLIGDNFYHGYRKADIGKVYSICIEEYDFADAWPLATPEQKHKAILFRRYI